MAGRLLLGTLTVLLVQGCLLPQDDQVLPDLPPKKNSRPSLFGTKPSNQDVELELGQNCIRETFEAYVDDPDLGDRIRSRWFVDPDQFFTTAFSEGRPLSASATSIRGPVKPPDLIFAPGSPLAVAKPHKLVLVIADGEFESGIEVVGRSFTFPDGGNSTPATFADGGINADGAPIPNVDPSYIDSYTWLVTTKLSPCP